MRVPQSNRLLTYVKRARLLTKGFGPHSFDVTGICTFMFVMLRCLAVVCCTGGCDMWQKN